MKSALPLFASTFALLLAHQALADTIASTDFVERTITGKTASNLSWITNGIADPGSLTWQDDLPQNAASNNAPLFDTSNAADHFAPQRNIDNRGAWSVNVPITLTVPQLDLGSVTLGWQHFNNSGNFQTADRSADWTISLTGSASGLMSTASATGIGGISGAEFINFPSVQSLDDSETYNLEIHVVGTTYPNGGNNTGLKSITLGNVAPPQPDDRPNIIFMMTDDQRFDTLGCYGHPVIQTPFIDSLAADGVRFENAFVTTAICAAGRASVLTGVTERSHGYTFGQPAVPSHFSAFSYPKLLRDAGYHTGLVGKYGVSMQTGSGALFNSFSGVPGFATSTPYQIQQGDGSFRHATDVAGDRAISYLDARTLGQPFCLSISFNAPHAVDGRTVADQSYPWPSSSDGLYETETLPGQGLNEAWFDVQPAFIRTSMNRVRFNWRFNTPEKFDAHMRAHLRLLTGVDTNVGRILAKLDETGLADNTIIVFTADNGLFLGARGFAGKWSHWEQSLRVPFIVYDPRLPENKRGRVESAIALNIDISPTILDWAGEEIPDRQQGLSLAEVVDDTSNFTRNDFFCEHHMDNNVIPKWEGIRDQRYKYAFYYEENYEYLHDLENDPGEWDNLANDPAYADILESMRARTDAYRAVRQTRDSIVAGETLIIDSEPDGLPDYWELENFGTLDGEPADDSDGDGASDHFELLAGTDPDEVTSRPMIQLNPDMSVDYSPYMPGRDFFLQYSSSLETGSWNRVDGSASFLGSTMSFNFSTPPAPRRFFRIGITDPLQP